MRAFQCAFPHVREVRGMAPVAQHEVGEGERHPFGHPLPFLVRVFEGFDRPVGLGLRTVLQRKARRQVVARERVIRERRERARFDGGGGGEILREARRRILRAGIDAEQRRSAVGEALGDGRAQREQVRARRLHDEHAAQAHRGHRQPHAAHAERVAAGAQRGFLEQVARLDQHLDRQSGRQHLDQVGVLRRGVAIRRDADEIVGEQREVVRRERMLAEAFEIGIVVRLDIAAVGLELRDGHRPHGFDQRRQALTEGFRGRCAVLELESERDDRIGRGRGFRVGEEALPAQDGAAPPRCAGGAPATIRPWARGGRRAAT